jgi:hypothetical protein
MQVNPYESPRAIEDGNRLKKVVPVHAFISVIVVPVAGIVGASVFVSILMTMTSLERVFDAAITFGIAATFSVLIGADCLLQRQRPAFVLAVFGMLLAAPIAFVFAFALGFVAYGMGTKGIAGSDQMFLLTYASFFFTLSLGGWLAIVRTRSA